MIEIIAIESALHRVNDDIFQEFCNHYLYLRLFPNSIHPIGSVIGKEKSRKGIPDCYIVNSDNELIFAEYTTRERLQKGESFYKKLESDINNCFNQSKTKLDNTSITKVILCFTERIKPHEDKKLRELCTNYNPACVLELKGIRDLAFAIYDYPILGKYLDISVGTGQILEPSKFIENYEKSKISTPLKNSFWGREKEMEEGLRQLDDFDILLVHGAAGTGKSKFALELARVYSNNNGYKFLCISNNGIEIWEDLKTFIRSEEKYILLVDDANRLSKNFQWILGLLNDRTSNTLKIIATVREYAFNQIMSITKVYDYCTIKVVPFLDTEIKKIIQSDDFKVHEPSHIDRIIKISKGNARLAIMCCRSKNILNLYDASQIYDEYFAPFFNDISLLKDPFVQKTLVIISFFTHISKENKRLYGSIFTAFNIDESKFWEVCYDLHEYELVDLYEQQVVKISDQIFATYIFYKVVIEKEVLTFSFFLDNYLEYENRINDTLIPIINTFSYKNVELKLKPVVLSKWVKISKLQDYNSSLKFLNLFWFYLSPQVLSFIKDKIDRLEPEMSTDFRYNYELNEFSSGVGHELEILSLFRYHTDDSFKDSLELMLYYAIKIPSKMPAISYIFKEKFCFSRLGYTNKYKIQHLLIDFLIENTKNSSYKTIYDNLLREVIPHYLKIEFHEDEGDGRKINIYTFKLWLSESIQSFREKCFNYLLFEAKKETILYVLSNLNLYEYRNSDEILQHDKKFIFEIINKHVDQNEFEDCFVLQNILESFEFLKVNSSNLINYYRNDLFILSGILKPNKYRRLSSNWEKEEMFRQKELSIYCSNLNVDGYFSLFSKIDSIISRVTKLNQNFLRGQYENSLNLILLNLIQTDYNIFIKVISLVRSKFRFNLNYTKIFIVFFQTKPQFYLELYNEIKDLDPTFKFYYHQTLDIASVKPEHFHLLYSDLLNHFKSIKSE